jgi:hypothetical protein
MITTFNSYINEGKSFSDYPFQMFHSKDNIASAVGGNSEKELINLAKKLNLKEFAIYKSYANGRTFYSTADEDFLISWYDKGGRDYWSNRSKKEPELLKKKIEKLDENSQSTDYTPKDEFSDKPIFVLWADKITKNFPNAIKKAMYKGKSNKLWNREYVTNAHKGYGTVFFIDANSVPEAKTELVKALQHGSAKNIYYFGANSKNMLDGIDWNYIINR